MNDYINKTFIATYHAGGKEISVTFMVTEDAGIKNFKQWLDGNIVKLCTEYKIENPVIIFAAVL